MTGGQFTRAILVWVAFMTMLLLVIGASIASWGLVTTYVILGVILVPLTLRWAYLLIMWDES